MRLQNLEQLYFVRHILNAFLLYANILLSQHELEFSHLSRLVWATFTSSRFSVGERCPGQPREVGKFQLVLAEEDVGIQKESMEYMIEERKRGVYNRGNTAAQDSGRIAEA